MKVIITRTHPRATLKLGEVLAPIDVEHRKGFVASQIFPENEPMFVFPVRSKNSRGLVQHPVSWTRPLENPDKERSLENTVTVNVEAL